MGYNDKMSLIKADIRKNVRLYILGIVGVYVFATIMTSQKVIILDATPNQILIMAGIGVGVLIVLYNVNAVRLSRKLKKSQ